MKKLTCGLVMATLLIYLGVSQIIDIDFMIKCTIIFTSLVVHKQGHKIMGFLCRKIKFKNLKLILVECGGVLTNWLIFMVFRETHFSYSGYIVVINFCLTIVNLLPLYPFDSYNIFKTILRIILKEDIVLKISGLASWLTMCLLFFVGIIQMVFFSYNCSVIITCLFISRFKRYRLNIN